MIRTILLSTFFLFVLSCSSDSKQSSTENNAVELDDITLKGTSFRPNGQLDANWIITILDNDSIILLASTAENLTDEPASNHQIYARLINSTEFDFEIVPRLEFYGTGCSKPMSPFLYSDSLPVYIDSALLPYFLGSNLQIQSNAGIKREMTVTSNLNIFRTVLANGDLDTSTYRMTFSPSSSFKFKPFTLRTGDRCAASIQTYDLQIRYYLNKKGNGYQLIIDQRAFYNKTDCTECIETIELKEN